MNRTALALILCLLPILFGCFPDPAQINPPAPEKEPVEQPEPKPEPEPEPEPDPEPDTQPGIITDPGIAYVWDENVIPEIHVSITEEEWNNLLTRYDEYQSNADYFHCDVAYKKGSEVTEIEDAGIRLRGNTSRRRPEGWEGQKHNKNNPDWHHCHFGLHFRKFHKDDEHTIQGIRKVNLKWFKDDPCYVRELYCYDLFRRAGIWTGVHDVYCRLWLTVGDGKPAYFGVYQMIESIDEEYVERRVDGMFKSDKGFLWKCLYGEGGMADLRSTNDWRFQIDRNDGHNYTYEFKGDEDKFEAAKEQFKDFIENLNTLEDEDFYYWIQRVCDVEFLLKTYAVNIAVGMWDDHWNNGNNFYLYFNSRDKTDYEVFFIPYDYDNTLGTSLQIGIQSDSGRHDPYEWGGSGVLMNRLMKLYPFKEMYKNALLELIDPAKGLLDMDASVERIEKWQNSIRDYVSNDTGEDMHIYDQPGSWGNHPEYRLLDKGKNNFFKVKAESITNM